jgi:DNA polymerase V
VRKIPFRVLSPEGKPIVILSNNDGCVIARSNEAKLLQVAMGAPYFKIQNYVKQEGIAVYSSNYALYGDLSNRVAQVLCGFAPKIEVYSIDECFLDFTGLPQDLTEYSLEICKTVKQWTGIPVSIGIAPTKTLAKLANRLAKKGYSASGAVLDWRSLANPDEVLATIALDDLWGISRRTAAKLQALGINNALELSQSDPKRLRQHLGVVMERIVCELQGLSCIPLEEMPLPRKQILTSRSFGEKLTRFEDLRAAVSYFATRSAEKLRRQQLATTVLTVFVATSPFDTQKPQYGLAGAFEQKLTVSPSVSSS